MKNTHDVEMKKMEPVFSRGSQAINHAIVSIFNKYELPDCDMYDLFYFHCLFLHILISRFPISEQGKYTGAIIEILKEQAQEGINFCTKIMTAHLTNTDEQQEAVEKLITDLGAEGKPIGQELISISNDIEKLSIKNDGIWKQKDNLEINVNILRNMEKELAIKFGHIIDKVLEDVNSQADVAVSPELCFLTTITIGAAVGAGYGSVLYRQSIDEFMRIGLQKLNGSFNEAVRDTKVGSNQKLN